MKGVLEMGFKCQELVTSPGERGIVYTYEQLNINSRFQQLWIQLSVFMRSYIYAVMFDLPNVESEAGRLFKVPADFRNEFLTFYGPEIADRMNELLTNFIAVTPMVLEGVKANNQELVNQGVKRWYQTADELAKFLDSVNLFWDTNQWRYLLYQYISLCLAMITTIGTKDYIQAVQIYDRIFDIVTIMGTYMARGLIAEQLQQRK